jgi:photosystem II stability/assembly factor-like uncharacterized protein
MRLSPIALLVAGFACTGGTTPTGPSSTGADESSEPAPRGSGVASVPDAAAAPDASLIAPATVKAAADGRAPDMGSVVDSSLPPAGSSDAAAVVTGAVMGKLSGKIAAPARMLLMATAPGKNRMYVLTGVQTSPPAPEGSIVTSLSTVWSSTDGGATWVELGKGAGSIPLTFYPSTITLDPEDPDTFWLGAKWTGAQGGVIKTSDGGNTFARLDKIEAELVSVDFRDPQRRTVITGRHENWRSVSKSVNGGTAWTQIGRPLPSTAALSLFPQVIDASTYLIGCSFMVYYGPTTARGATGIFRTTDGGATWKKVSNEAVFQNALVADGRIYWTFYNYTTNDGGLVRSDDGGQTWTTLIASGLNHFVEPMSLPGGRIAVMTAGKIIRISSDAGATWKDVRPAVTLNRPAGVTFNPVLDAFFVWELYGSIQSLTLP